MRTTIRSILLITSSALLGLSAGCARHVSVPVWQTTVERYVQEVGRGDPNVLRDLTTHDRRGFAIVGHVRPEQSTDANALLLAHRRVEGRPWFVYLVGLVERHDVQEIRLAALSIDNGRFNWKLSRPHGDSLDKYRQHNRRLWRQRFPGRSTAPLEYLGFPRDEDVFELKAQDGKIVAIHPASGARWELLLGSAAAAVAESSEPNPRGSMSNRFDPYPPPEINLHEGMTWLPSTHELFGPAALSARLPESAPIEPILAGQAFEPAIPQFSAALHERVVRGVAQSILSAPRALLHTLLPPRTDHAELPLEQDWIEPAAETIAPLIDMNVVPPPAPVLHEFLDPEATLPERAFPADDWMPPTPLRAAATTSLPNGPFEPETFERLDDLGRD